MGRGQRSLRSVTGCGFERGDGRIEPPSEQKIGPSDHQCLRRPVGRQGAGGNGIHRTHGIVGAPCELGGDGLTKCHETRSPHVAAPGQDLRPSEQCHESARVTPSPRQIAELEEHAGLAGDVVAGLERAADLFEPLILHRLVVLARKEGGFEPFPFGRTGSQEPGSLPGAEVGERCADGNGGERRSYDGTESVCAVELHGHATGLAALAAMEERSDARVDDLPPLFLREHRPRGADPHRVGPAADGSPADEG